MTLSQVASGGGGGGGERVVLGGRTMGGYQKPRLYAVEYVRFQRIAVAVLPNLGIETPPPLVDEKDRSQSWLRGNSLTLFPNEHNSHPASKTHSLDILRFYYPIPSPLTVL